MNSSLPRRASSDRWSPRLLQDLANAPDLPSAADDLISHNVPVFPCVPGGKRPLTAHGFQDASTDPTLIGSWWDRWPEANIGVPTGAVSGVDVVDVDVHSAGTGFAYFEEARRAGLVNGWIWLVRTPSGGAHAYFPADGEQRSWQVPGKHIDFRGDGGYIIVAPSRVTTGDGVSRSYRQIAVARHHDPRSVDAASLKAFLDPPRPMQRPVDLPPVGARPDRLAAYVASRPEGGRNRSLFWAACRMAEEGHDFTTATSLLTEAACVAGRPEREARTTIESAYRTATRLGSTISARPTNTIEGVRL
ncbi:MAG: bifunctional DNA primase/polymerase [Nocardioides sp.]|uniref:bifunctional DNA primase/polymerase n=1 Tax=Nocardioides sp. TaxID=35761 RepID=UPI00239AA2D2|nr:bifunctional DNA primase/polymerase [Nocardioides sp.]MDE0775233.1 bifunctional DNA primase/polymerase [Nocardioides sp.]